MSEDRKIPYTMLPKHELEELERQNKELKRIAQLVCESVTSSVRMLENTVKYVQHKLSEMK